MTKDGKVFGKFNVTRTDGQSAPNCKHNGCDYFVLDTTCDEFAVHALQAYIDACKETHPELAKDMEQRYKVPDKSDYESLMRKWQALATKWSRENAELRQTLSRLEASDE